MKNYIKLIYNLCKINIKFDENCLICLTYVCALLFRRQKLLFLVLQHEHLERAFLERILLLVRDTIANVVLLLRPFASHTPEPVRFAVQIHLVVGAELFGEDVVGRDADLCFRHKYRSVFRLALAKDSVN